jgi:D-alanyl-D-alanine carboxypeptidase/D-alanyl-D-alanine-endopeptidase (penicillin-binding protein 4)
MPPMTIRKLRQLRAAAGAAALLLLAALPPASSAQSRVARHVADLIDRAPLDRAVWGILVVDERGREIFSRNADRLFVPASNTKLVVTAVASVLLPPEYRPVTSLYGAGPIADSVLEGDLVAYGRGDPTFSARCYDVDTTAVGVCDSLWSKMDDLAAQVAARGIRHVRGAVVGDGSFFVDDLVHPGWNNYDLNWWYAAPVGGLGFNDNSLDLTYAPDSAVGAPVRVRIEPDVGLFLFENRSQTLPAGTRRSIDFFRAPGTSRLWAEGGVPLRARERTEYFAVPDPNLFFAAALRVALARHGISVGGPTESTTDSLRYAEARDAPAIAEVQARPLADQIFPILNSSQNWFAEMLLKSLGKAAGGHGSWDGGLEVERRFLIDSVGIDSTAFSLADGSGLSAGNLVTPRAFVTLLSYMRTHPRGAGFQHGLPRAGENGSLRDRFRGTALEGRVVAKTGSISHVNSLSGYVERADGRALIFSIIVNNHAVPSGRVLAAIDSVVVAASR